MSSAPGKIILFGEHAVVYGRPALAVPVMQVHADVEVLAGSRAGIWIDAPDINLHAGLDTLPPTHPLASVINGTLTALGISSPPALKLRITSSIPVASGLGSGAAVSVAVIRELSAALEHSLDDEKVNRIAYETEKLHHGTPSGIDNTVITYAMPVFFVRGQPIEVFRVGKPFTVVIGNTGIAAPTKESVGDVRKLWQADPAKWETVFDEVANIVLKAKSAIESGNLSILGELMNRNHALLQEMTVSCPELDVLVSAALSAGAQGAKLSGGGRGGNMIALVSPDNATQVAGALEAAGAKRVLVTEISRF